MFITQFYNKCLGHRFILVSLHGTKFYNSKCSMIHIITKYVFMLHFYDKKVFMVHRITITNVNDTQYMISIYDKQFITVNLVFKTCYTESK